MATSYPTALDTLTNPTSTDTLDSVTVPHDGQHANANDAIEALQSKVGINSSADTNSLDYKVNNHSGNLIAEYIVSGSSVTSIDFTGLDINTHKSYRIEIVLVNATASSATLYMFINGDTTVTNYYIQYFSGNGTAITAARANTSSIASLDPSFNGYSNGILDLVGGYPTGTFFPKYGPNSTTPVFGPRTYNKTATVTNITQLTFTSTVAGAIGIGSKIRIYRG